MKDHFPVSPPPIPTPDGNIPQVQNFNLPLERGDWKTAPPIVRGWAYPLTWLGIVVLPLVIGVILLTSLGSRVPNGGAGAAASDTTAVLLPLLFFVALFAVDIWLNRSLKKGVAAAWVAQIVLSGFVVLSSALSLLSGGGNAAGGLIGTAIHAYILSQWFKPETKAWFGKN